MSKKALKEAPYVTNGRVGRVVYAIEGSRCVFCGISGRDASSTINAAEEIVEAIVRLDGVDPKTMVFYDLQTTSGYPNKVPGDYDFDRLDVEVAGGGQRIIVNDWTPDDCPEDILRKFAKHLR